MATSTTSSPVSHNDTAGFRAWVSELIGMLTAAGLTRTSDTGQIDTTTVTLPSMNTLGGYTMWRFNDALQATAPVFIKLEFGTSSSTTTPVTYVTVGPGTDGAGNLTGVHVPRRFVTNAPAGITSVGITPYQSYVCYFEGALGVCFKQGAMQGSGGPTLIGFALSRPIDASGAWTAEGITYVDVGTLSAHYAVAFGYATSYAPGQNTYHTFTPYQPSSSVSGSTYQVYRTFGMYPAYRTLGGVFGGLATEIGVGNVLTVALEGSVTRNYISLKDQNYAPSSSNCACAMIWQ